MRNSNICCICLNNNTQLLINDENSKQMYLDITGLKWEKTLKLCTNCEHYLRKFHKFKQKCLLSSEIISKNTKQKMGSTLKMYELNFINIKNHVLYNFTHENIFTDHVKYEQIPTFQINILDNKWNEKDEMAISENACDDVEMTEEISEPILIKTEEQPKEKNKIKKNKIILKTRKELEQRRLSDKRFKKPYDLELEFTIEQFLTEKEKRVEFERRRDMESYTESKYKCEKCYKGFREQKLLDLHSIKHEEISGKYLCKICNIRLSTPKRYRTHNDSNHVSKFSCKQCDFVSFSKAQARNHLLWHQGVEHGCPHCAMTFRKYTTLMGHIRRLHPSVFICGSCANSFVSAHGLNHHVKLMHKDKKNHTNMTDRKACEECKVTFDSNKIYIKHLLISPKHEDEAANIIGCRECGEEFAAKELLEKHKHKEVKTVEKREKERCYTCPHCNQQFSHPSSLYQHFVRSHPNIPYKVGRERRHCLCEWCGKTFMCQSKLITHKRIHTGEKPFKCDLCPKNFRTQLALSKHVNIHNGVRLHPCSVCGKHFTNSGNLFKHMRIHSGIKPFKCDICNKSFVDSSNLRQHIQGVHYNVPRIRKKSSQ